MSVGSRTRVWQRARARAHEDGYRIMLDERPLRLPGGAVLSLRARALAEAVAAEWDAAGGGVGSPFGPEALGLTRLAATLQERVAPARAAAAAMLLAGIDGDLLCYRAAHPASLVVLQDGGWQPWLDWCRRVHGADFVVRTGVMPVAQPEPVRAAMGVALARQDDATLTALAVLAPLLGSLVLGFAVTEGALAPEAASDLSLLDALHQGERWGVDPEVTERRAQLAREALEVRRFVALTRPAAAERWLIEGRVQGVGYRIWLQEAARALDLRGWVRNLLDGRVEAMLSGPPDRLAELRLAALRGPALARVDRVAASDWAGPVPEEGVARRADAAAPEPPTA